MSFLINEAYSIGDKNDAILKGNIKISRNVNCLLFGYYCDSTIFYKKFFRVAADTLRVNKKARKTIKEVKKIIKNHGYKKVWSKGVFSIYGDLRPLAVKAGFGRWGKSGIVENEKYGSNFLICAVFYK